MPSARTSTGSEIADSFTLRSPSTPSRQATRPRREHEAPIGLLAVGDGARDLVRRHAQRGAVVERRLALRAGGVRACRRAPPRSRSRGRAGPRPSAARPPRRRRSSRSDCAKRSSQSRPSQRRSSSIASAYSGLRALGVGVVQPQQELRRHAGARAASWRARPGHCRHAAGRWATGRSGVSSGGIKRLVVGLGAPRGGVGDAVGEPGAAVEARRDRRIRRRPEIGVRSASAFGVFAAQCPRPGRGRSGGRIPRRPRPCGSRRPPTPHPGPGSGRSRRRAPGACSRVLLLVLVVLVAPRVEDAPVAVLGVAHGRRRRSPSVRPRCPGVVAGAQHLGVLAEGEPGVEHGLGVHAGARQRSTASRT